MLNQIMDSVRSKIDACKQARPLGTFSVTPGDFAFRRAFDAGWALIAECKRASPVKGTLCPMRSVPELAEIFTANGAAALSVHTSAPFAGRIEDLAAVRSVSPLPILCKDFIIDAYQLFAARAAGADAVLLIAAILDDANLKRFLDLSRELGMDCLVETHTRSELERVRRTDASIVGINNRDLETFTTDIAHTFRLLPHCDPRWLLVSESGIRNASDVRLLQKAGIGGALVGESLVTAPDIAAMTRAMAQKQIRGEEDQHA